MSSSDSSPSRSPRTPDVYRPVFNTIRILIGLYPDAPWDADQLSCHPSITWSIVKTNPQISWNFLSLSHHMPVRYILEAMHDTPCYDWYVNIVALRCKHERHQVPDGLLPYPTY